MKKTYQIPEIECQFAEGDDLMQTASLPMNLVEGQNLENAPETSETSGNLSRKSIWDDED